ncbi:MAG: hypothetical protein IKK43_02965 [Clostridia bacterium]|nr:hypothetical protein [Clostridia bacterium]
MFSAKEFIINNIKFRLYIVVAIIIFSLITYIQALVVYEEFDFGSILELLTLIFTIISIRMISKEKVPETKMITFAAILPEVALITFDIINCFVLKNGFFDIRMNFFTIILPIIFLLDIYRFLKKIDALEEKLQKDIFYGKETE